MTPPRLSEVGTELERGLLASARLDVSGDDGLKRTLVALGAGASALSASAQTAAAASAGAGGAAAAAGGPAMLGGAGAGMLAKWVGIAVIVGGGAALSAAPSIHRMRAKTGVAASAAAVLSTVAGRNATPGANPRPLTETASDLPSSLPSPAASAPVSPATVPASPYRPARSIPLRPPSSLPDELAMLDRARASLTARDAPAALRQLDAYDRAFPTSVLADEALVLRVDALVAQSDRAEAAALGRRFLATHPASPHAPHLLHLLGGAHNP